MLEDDQIAAGNEVGAGAQRFHPEEGVVAVVLFGGEPVVLLPLDDGLLDAQIHLVADIEQSNLVVKLDLSALEPVGGFYLPQTQLLS